MYQFLWIFFIYAFLGWCTEVSYAALNTGKFVNRGFLNGPVCPIYGFGVVIVLACLIFSAFMSSGTPVVDTTLSAVTMSWQYIGETIFNMLVLVGLVKGAERIVREMFGL